MSTSPVQVQQKLQRFQRLILDLITRVKGVATLTTLKRLLKLYGIFSVVNVFSKIYYEVYETKRTRALWKHLPGEDYDPYATQMKANAHRWHEFFLDRVMAHPHADLIKTSGPYPEIICNSPRAIQWMLKDEFEHVTKAELGQSYLFEMIREFIGGDGIFVLRHGLAPQFVSDNGKWFEERKITSRIFTKVNFETFMYETFVEKAHIMINRLKNVEKNAKRAPVKTDKADKATFEGMGVVDIQELFFSYTMDSIEKIFFGNEVNTIDGGMSNYSRAFDAAHLAMMNMLFKSVLLVLFVRYLLPPPFGKLTRNSPHANTLAFWLFRNRYITPDSGIFRDSMKMLDCQVHEYINKTRNDPKIGEKSHLVAMFLNSNFRDQISDKVLRDIVLNLTIAGRDTTACVMTWMFFIMTTEPEIQEKLYEELMTKLPTDLSYMPNLKDLSPENVPYLHGLMFEALRLYPPVPNDNKYATKDLQYLDGTQIPRGTKLFFLPYAIGRNPNIFPDPEKVMPERWIPFKEKQKTQYEFPMFQAGPRICLGKDMAQFEAKLLVAILVRHFKFEILEGEKEKITYTIMLTMALANDKNRKSQKLLIIPKLREQAKQN